MKKKNPILNFRIESKNDSLLIDSGKYCLVKGVCENSFNSKKNEIYLPATLITRTRETVDMSESSNS